jgi:hypothetical protein
MRELEDFFVTGIQPVMWSPEFVRLRFKSGTRTVSVALPPDALTKLFVMVLAFYERTLN